MSTGVEREMKLDLNKNAAAQDMIRIIMRDKSMLPDEAVKFAINRQMHQKILQEGYASIAFDLWGTIIQNENGINSTIPLSKLILIN